MTYPNLKTVLMVEEVLKKQKKPVPVSELKTLLPKKVNHNTLKTILEYLDESKKIDITMDGIDWIFKPRYKDQKISTEAKEKVITCNHCGRRHVDYGRFSKINHRKHLCEYCKRYFFDKERAVGI